MKCDPQFATSPICVDDKDYEFSVNLELITLVEYDPFHGYESETVVAHLTKLNDIATLFAHDEKIHYYYILKLFSFSLKGDAKAWYMIPLQRIYNFLLFHAIILSVLDVLYALICYFI